MYPHLTSSFHYSNGWSTPTHQNPFAPLIAVPEPSYICTFCRKKHKNKRSQADLRRRQRPLFGPLFLFASRKHRHVCRWLLASILASNRILLRIFRRYQVINRYRSIDV